MGLKNVKLTFLPFLGAQKFIAYTHSNTCHTLNFHHRFFLLEMGSAEKWILNKGSKEIQWRYILVRNIAIKIGGYVWKLVIKGIIPRPTTTLSNFWVISIVINSDRRHCCEHLKKNMMKIERVTCIWMFVYAMNFWAPRNGKKINFTVFRPNLCEFWVISSSILYVNGVLEKFQW